MAILRYPQKHDFQIAVLNLPLVFLSSAEDVRKEDLELNCRRIPQVDTSREVLPTHDIAAGLM